MTNHGFIFIDTGTTMKDLCEIARKISTMRGVDTAHVVTGQKGIIAYFETGIGTFAALRDILTAIHGIQGVHSTETYIGLHSYARGKEIHFEHKKEK